MEEIYWLQLLRREYLIVCLPLHDSKLNNFALRTFLGCDFGLWETVSIFFTVGRETVKKRTKIQSSKRDTELLMSNYTEALSLNWCDLKLDESLCWPNESVAANHSAIISSLYTVVPHNSNNNSVLAAFVLCQDLVLPLNPSCPLNSERVGGDGGWELDQLCVWMFNGH